MRKYLSCMMVISAVNVVSSFDDWPLVMKYCTKKDPSASRHFANVSLGRFYVYEDEPVYEKTLRRAFEEVLGGMAGPLRRPHQQSSRKALAESEFHGEVIIWCDLLTHPLRTWNRSEASLFIVPAFPYLLPDSTAGIAAALEREPSWRRRRGADHLVLCTHWGCAARLKELFRLVALPGFVAGLERNAKWLDPRLHRVDMDADWARVAPTALRLERGDHPLCLERIIPLPCKLLPSVGFRRAGRPPLVALFFPTTPLLLCICNSLHNDSRARLYPSHRHPPP